jgi:hypothetical protein
LSYVRKCLGREAITAFPVVRFGGLVADQRAVVGSGDG